MHPYGNHSGQVTFVQVVLVLCVLYRVQRTHNGLVMVNFYPNFVTCSNIATVADVAGKLLPGRSLDVHDVSAVYYLKIDDLLAYLLT